MVTTTKEKLPSTVGWMSCVGFMNNNYPVQYGNYFTIEDGAGRHTRIINMWAENFREICKILSLEEVEVTVYSAISDEDKEYRLGLITDSRIPKDWITELCFTGYGATKELYEEICKVTATKIPELCTCLKSNQAPKGWESFSFSNTAINHHCSRCKRDWQEQ